MSMSRFKIPAEMRNILLENQSIVDYVGDNVFSVRSDEGTGGDFISLQRDGFEEERSKMGVARRRPYVYAYIVSSDSWRSQCIACLVEEALECTFRNPDMTIECKDDSEEFESGKFIQVLKFLVTI